MRDAWRSCVPAGTSSRGSASDMSRRWSTAPARRLRRCKVSENPVYVVSGGFFQSVTVLAQAVGIDSSHVRAVEIHLDDTGGYAGFDTSSPLVRGDGKAEICRDLAARHGPVAIVGDGITDLAARAGGAYVVGFGGVARRQAMADGADYFVAEAPLTHALKALLSPAEFEETCLAVAKRQREQDLKGD